jgi:hypothetical protein
MVLDVCLIQYAADIFLFLFSSHFIQVTKQLLATFKPDPKSLKKIIDDLITREYMDRDAANANLYKYVA